MKRQTILIAFAALVVSMISSLEPAHAQQSFTYPDLVSRMTDLEHLAVLPAPGEECAQWSSYDRASKYDAEKGVYVSWGANNDGPQFIREEGDLAVMAEMEGPGCLWRVWSALAQKGRVKIFLDGSETPAVDLPFQDYFNGKTPPFDYPMLSYNMSDLGSRGHNLYYPIPYQKSCKIVAEDGWGRYFQFVYTTFPEGTKVPTFTGKLSEADAAALAKLNDFLANEQGTDPAGERQGQQTVSETFTLRAGGSEKLVLDGPRAITAIKGSMATGNREDEMAALRNIVLKITFDDQEEPSVWCPLGDFFGTAPGKNLYKSLITGMTEEGAYAYWYMPFGKRAVIELVSEDDKDRQIECAVTHAPLAQPMDKLGYFHCKWHRDICPLPPDRHPDWVMLRTQGRGRFCGVMLHVWDPKPGWWGEGDEKFFVDGEKFPSTIGTGSEDYFGYAWCCPALFQRPFHAQSMTQGNAGHQSVLRWHVADNVPFQESFEAAIEKYFPNGKPTLYACTPVWYQAAGGSDPIEPVPAEERWGYCVTPPPGGGGYKVLGKPNGQVQSQGMAHFGAGKWHDNNQLWWTDAKPGDKLDVAFDVKQGGTYRVDVTLTKARDYAIVQLSIDGKRAGEPIDLYNPQVIPTGPVELGSFKLDKGEHTLGVEIVGANDKAVKSYMFGLNQILLKAVE
jgi:hypothetical protein